MRLPVFHDLPIEEPNQHLSRFVTIVESMGPDLADPQILKMKAFPFSLDGAALDWLEELPVGESVTFFYQGLLEGKKGHLNSIAQGAFMDLSHDDAEKLIAKGAANELQYGNRAMSGVNQGVGSDQRLSKIEENIEKLSALMLSGKTPKAQVCGICSTPGHFTDVCPTLMDPSYEDVNVFGFANHGGNQFLNTYNPRWRDHPNLRYGNTSNALNGFQFQNTSTPLGFQQRGQGSQNIGGDNNIEKLFSKLVDGQMEMQKQCTTNSQEIKEMQKQLGDVIKKINQEHEPGRLPRTTHPNLKFEHANIITIKSGRNVIATRKVLENEVDRHGVERDPTTEKASHNKKVEEKDDSQAHEILHEKKNKAESEHKKLEEQTSPKSAGKSCNSSNPVITNSPFDYVPFPAKLVETKKSALETNILETFRKVHINLPLLECIQNLPAYAKVLKDLCTKRRRLKGREVVEMKENVSAVL
ncbi:uncharacterized protein LOC141665662 [Apium graveolens]|uniref:uncharacterized protein LOC141665662 n=1 Tax=Apium graveolens TaxID=4045 RepID=UPI003D7B7716